MAAGKQRATLAWISTEADSPRAVRLLRARRHLAELGIELRPCWRLFHDEEIARARADCCRTRSYGRGCKMRPGTRRDDRNHAGLAASGRRSFGTTRHIGERPGGHGTNGTPSVHPWRSLLGRIRGQAGIYRPRPDNITALHSRLDDSFR